MGIFGFAVGLVGSVILILFIVLLIQIIGLIQRKFPTSSKLKKTIWKISLAFVLVSPFVIPIQVENQVQFRNLSFGLPFKFVEQHTHNAIANISFPFNTTLFNPWGHSITSNLNIRMDQFIFSVICTYVVIYLLYYVMNRNRATNRE